MLRTSFPLTCLCSPGDEIVTVKTPAFAESVTEGDVRWEKGNSIKKKNNTDTTLVIRQPESTDGCNEMLKPHFRPLQLLETQSQRMRWCAKLRRIRYIILNLIQRVAIGPVKFLKVCESQSRP